MMPTDLHKRTGRHKPPAPGTLQTPQGQPYEDWRWQFSHRLTRLSELPEPVRQRLIASFSRLREKSQDSGLPAGFPAGDLTDPLPFPLPLAVTPYFMGLACPEDQDDPILRQVIPSAGELLYREYELTDPLGEDKYMPVPGLIHRYTDRALVLATNVCACYCRFCFRRNYTGRAVQAPGEAELAEIVLYLKKHPEIKEIILSGGDPLTLEDGRLYTLLATLRAAGKELYFRIGTRVPVVMPQRLEPALIRLLAAFKPLWLVIHINHPRELQPASQDAIARLIEAGMPVLSQTVLLRGINDEQAVLAALFHKLVALRVKPYYLFQGDLARGTAHFRTPLKRGLELMAALKNHLSGLALPVYAVDLPGGGGKISLTPSAVKQKKDWFALKSGTGRIYRYPVEL